MLWCYVFYLTTRCVRVQGGVKRSSMRDIITSPSQISTTPSSCGPCYNKGGTDDRNGRNNPNIQDGGNAIRYMACLLSQKGGTTDIIIIIIIILKV
jgi:hypothetical protein